MRLILTAILSLTLIAMSAHATDMKMTGMGDSAGGGGGGTGCGTLNLSTGCFQPALGVS